MGSSSATSTVSRAAPGDSDCGTRALSFSALRMVFLPRVGYQVRHKTIGVRIRYRATVFRIEVLAQRRFDCIEMLLLSRLPGPIRKTRR